jgi:hypothetical protein
LLALAGARWFYERDMRRAKAISMVSAMS